MKLVILCIRKERGGRMKVELNGQVVEYIESFKYLVLILTVNGVVESDVGKPVN